MNKKQITPAEAIATIRAAEYWYKKVMRVSDDAKYYPLNPLNIEMDTEELIQPKNYENLLSLTQANIVALIREGLNNPKTRIMLQAIKQWWRDRRNFAQYGRDISCDMQDYEEIVHIFEFIRQTIRYLKDPKGRELLNEAIATAFFAGGDCDDMDILLCTLLAQAGHDFQLLLAGDNGDYSHIFVAALLPGGKNAEYIQFYLDPTNKVDPPGWKPDFDNYLLIFDSRYDMK